MPEFMKSMSLGDRLKHALAAPIWTDHSIRARRIALLHIILAAIIVALPILIVVNLTGRSTPLPVVMLNVLFLLVCIFLRFVLCRRQPAQVSLTLVLLAFGYVTLAITQLGTIRSPTTTAYVIIIIAAGLLFEWRGLLAITTLCSGAVLGIIWAEGNGWLPTPDYSVGLTQWWTYTLIFGAVSGMTLAAFQALQYALTRMDAELKARKRTEAQLLYLSTHDSLTGIYNRAFFETEMDRLSTSRELPISLLVADLDNMKVTNDTLGHAVGDQLLRDVTQVLQSSLRVSDILARIGGDEFAVLLPYTDATTARQIVLRIHKHLDALNRMPGILPLHLSLGIATMTSGNLRETFKLADAQMYADKHQRKTQ